MKDCDFCGLPVSILTPCESMNVCEDCFDLAEMMMEEAE